jgi:hypothetical protein
MNYERTFQHVLVGCFVWFMGYLALDDVWASAVMLPVTLGVLTYWRYFMLKLRHAFEEARMEAVLPEVLIQLSSTLAIGYPIDKIVSQANYEKAEILQRFKSCVNSGMPFAQCCKIHAQSFSTPWIKRTFIEMQNVEKLGANKHSADILLTLAEEILEAHARKVKETHARFALTGTLFVVLSTVVPAMLLAYYYVGSTLLGFTFDVAHLAIIMFVVLPAASLMVLFTSTLPIVGE